MTEIFLHAFHGMCWQHWLKANRESSPCDFTDRAQMQPCAFWEPQTAPVTRPPTSLPTPSHPRPPPPLISHQAGGTKQSSWVAKHSGWSVCIKKGPSMWLILPPAHSPPPPSSRHPSMFPAEAASPADIPWDGWSCPAVSVLSATIWEEAEVQVHCRRHVLKNVWLPFHWPSRLTGQEAKKREREKCFWTPYTFLNLLSCTKNPIQVSKRSLI